MNNKILSVVLVVGIATTGFAGISAANNTTNSSENKGWFERWVKRISEKSNHFGKRKGLAHLTEEEKTALETMSDDEKKTFFDAKKAKMKAQKEAGKTVIDKLIAGESLTAAEEATRLEMIAKIEDFGGNHTRKGKGEWREIIAKILAGDELSADEEIKLAQMQAKRAERESQRKHK